MKNRDLILLLIHKSTNAFGQVLGLTEDAKLKVALVIIQSIIKDSFDINSTNLTSKALADTLEKEQLDLDQTHLLTNLLWAQADILLKLNQPAASMIQYENALQLIHWQTQQTGEKSYLERKNKITELETVITTLRPPNIENIKISMKSIVY